MLPSLVNRLIPLQELKSHCSAKLRSYTHRYTHAMEDYWSLQSASLLDMQFKSGGMPMFGPTTVSPASSNLTMETLAQFRRIIKQDTRVSRSRTPSTPLFLTQRRQLKWTGAYSYLRFIKHTTSDRQSSLILLLFHLHHPPRIHRRVRS